MEEGSVCFGIWWLTSLLPALPQNPRPRKSSKMADGLKMNGLSLNDSQHAPSHPGGRSAYIPPHLRNQSRAGPGPAPVGFDGSGPPPGGPPINAGGAWGPGYVDIFCVSLLKMILSSEQVTDIEWKIEMPVRGLVSLLIGQTLLTLPPVAVLR
jgi:hypothetical protein